MLLLLWRFNCSFLANQKARNAIVGAENLLKCIGEVEAFAFVAIHSIYCFAEGIL